MFKKNTKSKEITQGAIYVIFHNFFVRIVGIVIYIIIFIIIVVVVVIHYVCHSVSFSIIHCGCHVPSFIDICHFVICQWVGSNSLSVVIFQVCLVP